MSDPMQKIRVSALPQWPDCPRRAASKLFRHELIACGFTFREAPGGIGAAIGSAVHAGSAYMLETKAERGTLPSLDQSIDQAFEVGRRRMDEGVIFDKETPSTSHAETQIKRMTRAYYVGPAQRISPITVEERLEAVAPFGNFILSGQSDVVAREPGAVRDTKTGKKRGNYRAQIGGYSLLNRAHGLDIVAAYEDYVPRVSLTKDQPDAISYVHDVAGAETAALSTLGHIARCLNLFREGDPAHHMLPGDPWAFPANPSSMLCGAKYCDCHSCPKETSFCNEWQEKESSL